MITLDNPQLEQAIQAADQGQLIPMDEAFVQVLDGLSAHGGEH